MTTASATVEYAERIAVVTVSNPPVNTISSAVRDELHRALDGLESRAGLSAVVLMCSGSTFFSGADISEFSGPPQEEAYRALFRRLEGLPVPVVAAMHGTVLGGGLEIALACHYRIARPGTRFGLPEITLGVIPGAGGTQRMPRLIGVEKTLDLVLSREARRRRDGQGARLPRRGGRWRAPRRGDRLRQRAHRRRPRSAPHLRAHGRSGERDGGSHRALPQARGAAVPEPARAADGDRGGRCRRAPAARGRARVRDPARERGQGDRRGAGTGARVLRGTRDAQGSRSAARHDAAAGAVRGRRRLGHDGRWDRDLFRERRSAGHGARREPRGARPRARGRRTQLRFDGEARAREFGGEGPAPCADTRDARVCGPRRCGRDHRGRTRADGPQERGLLAARHRREARCGAGHEHLYARHRRDRDRRQTARRRDRAALLLAGERDAAARSRAHGEQLGADHPDSDGARAPAAQDARARARLLRLHRQPDDGRLRARGAADRAGGGDTAPRRCRARGLRDGDGHPWRLRHGGHRRRRQRAPLERQPLSTGPDLLPGGCGFARRGAPRSEERPGLLSLRARGPDASRRRGGDRDPARDGEAAGRRAAGAHRPGNPRAMPVSADQRGHPNPGRRCGDARRRRRRGVDVGLRLPPVSRRAAFPRRPHRPREGVRGDHEIPRNLRTDALGARAAPDAAGGGGPHARRMGRRARRARRGADERQGPGRNRRPHARGGVLPAAAGRGVAGVRGGREPVLQGAASARRSPRPSRTTASAASGS